MGKKKWMQEAVKRPGQLHRDLGVPEGEEIPIEKLRAAAKRKDKVGQRARLALIFRKYSKKGKKGKERSRDNEEGSGRTGREVERTSTQEIASRIFDGVARGARRK